MNNKTRQVKEIESHNIQLFNQILNENEKLKNDIKIMDKNAKYEELRKLNLEINSELEKIKNKNIELETKLKKIESQKNEAFENYKKKTIIMQNI